MSIQTYKTRAGLTEAEAAQLETLEGTLPLTAQLVNSDVFIDCWDVERGRLFVAAQAAPLGGVSLYAGSVVGADVLEADEPAAYQAYTTGLQVRDIRGVTQENSAVRQDVVPVRSAQGRVIAVLICEHDVSNHLARERKYHALARQAAPELPEPVEEAALYRREVHHRVKNQLQMLASILNMHARATGNPEAGRILRESTARVLGIAEVEDLLTAGGEEAVSLLDFLERLRARLALIYGSGRVRLLVEGDDLTLPGRTVSDVALVTSELVGNAYEHAFPNGRTGTITVSVHRGKLYGSLLVADDGVGFDTAGAGGLGLAIVRMTVESKLKGKLRLSSGAKGSQIAFDFWKEN